MKVDGTEGTIILEGRWAVDQRVLAPKLFFNLVEAGGYVLDADGVESLTAGGFGDDAEDLVGSGCSYRRHRKQGLGCGGRHLFLEG